MNVVISGAGGFLGKAIVNQLIKNEKYEIFALTSQIEKMQLQYEGIGKLHFIEHTKYKEIDFSKVHFLISCAFPTNAEDGVQMAQGLEYVCELLHYASVSGVKHIVDISTQSVYGTQRKYKADEGTEINLDTKYAVGKYYTELMLNTISDKCRITHYRIASLIGPGFDKRITNILIKNLIQGLPLRVVDGAQIMGYMDVRDAADAITSSLEKLDDSHNEQVYNIASNSYSLSDIVSTIVTVGREFQLETQPVVYEETGKYRNTSMEASKFREAFQWKHQYELEDTVREIFKAMLKEKNRNMVENQDGV